MGYGLVDALEYINVFYVPEMRCLQLPSGLICPGGWVVFAVFGCDNFRFWDEVLYNDSQKSYASTIRFEEVMGNGVSVYRNRPNQGDRYSSLVKLESKNDADDASNTINSCVSYCLDRPSEKGSKDIKGVVAELHDNVWSHGKGTGISMAQLYDHECDDNRFEFALADCGFGFLEELRRANVPGVADLDDIDAIRKCIEKDFSTKNGNDRDEWAQRLPDGHIGRSPYSEGIDTFDEDNNHQGLGLWKLVELVKLYNGTLFLASGDAIFIIKNGVEQSPLIGKINWKGVAVSCSFPLSLLSINVGPPQVSKDVEDLIGGWDIVGD